MKSVPFRTLFITFTLTGAVESMASIQKQKGVRGGIRSLETIETSETESEYLNECQAKFLGADVTSDGMISQREFSGAYHSLCLEYSSDGNCATDDFSSLSVDLQDVFFEAVCSPMPNPEQCAEDLITINSIDFGYIVSQELMPQVQVHVAQFCIEMMDSVFNPSSQAVDFAGDNNGLPFDDANVSSETEISEPVVTEPPILLEAESEAATPGSLDLTSLGTAGDAWFNFNGQSSNKFTNGPLVGIAVAAGACLIFFSVVALKRRLIDSKREGDEDLEKTKPSRFNPAPFSGFRSKTSETSTKTPSSRFVSTALSISQASSSTSSSQLSYIDAESARAHNVMTEVEDAIVAADWDTLYRLASELAEKEDLISPAEYKVNDENRNWRRRNLSAQDMTRAEALDDLILTGDWTCVAVTAALYAGESGVKSSSSLSVTSLPKSEENQPYVQSTMSQQSLLELKNTMDQAVGQGNWDQVLALSSQVEGSREYQSRPPVNGTQQGLLTDFEDSDSQSQLTILRNELDLAVRRGDWGLVGMYADRMKESSHIQEMTESTSLAIVPAVRPQVPLGSPTALVNAADMNKQTTIQRLVEAGKWNGVKIMAGLYEMESKGSLA